MWVWVWVWVWRASGSSPLEGVSVGLLALLEGVFVLELLLVADLVLVNLVVLSLLEL